MCEKSQDSTSKINRRTFLQAVGASAAAATIAGCNADPNQFSWREPKPPEMATREQSDWTPSICQLCPAGCGILARVIDGRVVKIEGNPAHPMNQGKVCPRAQASLQVLYDPDRIKGPLRRVGERGADQWESISWDEAIEDVADRLSELKSQGKEDGLLFLHDTPPSQMQELIIRFGYGFGTPNVVSIDGWDGERLSNQLTQGWHDLAAFDWERTSYALFFGGSYLEDWQPQVHMLRSHAFIRRGSPDRRGRIVLIGPRLSVSAAKADEWVPLLPGREGALALGMAHVIVREQIYDHSFIDEHTGYFSDLVSQLEQYSPSQVAGLTGVAPETITRLAREFAGAESAVAAAGRGLSSSTNELYNRLAIQTLNALVGNIGKSGGIFQPPNLPLSPWHPAAPTRPEGTRFDGAGELDYPLAASAYSTMGERIRSGPHIPEVLFLYETNPLYQAMGASMWRENLIYYIPYIVSFSSFMDESTSLADLVLPNHTFLERWVDAIPPGGPNVASVGIGPPAVEALYDTRHSGRVLMQLAQRLGGDLADLLPWSDYETVLRTRTEGLQTARGSISANSAEQFWSQLLRRGVWFGIPEDQDSVQANTTDEAARFIFRFDTIREALESAATDPGSLGLSAKADELALPHFEPPRYAGSPNDYPLHLMPYQLITDAGVRAPNSPLLWEMYGLHIKESWQSWLEIHPETAERYGIAEGDQVLVESPQGQIQLVAHLYEGAMPDLICIPMGGGKRAGGRWATQVGGGNVVDLVVPLSDPLSGCPAWSGTRVNVSKIESGS